jgi:hypothetical protein
MPFGFDAILCSPEIELLIARMHCLNSVRIEMELFMLFIAAKMNSLQFCSPGEEVLWYQIHADSVDCVFASH